MQKKDDINFEPQLNDKTFKMPARETRVMNSNDEPMKCLLKMAYHNILGDTSASTNIQQLFLKICPILMWFLVAVEAPENGLGS